MTNLRQIHGTTVHGLDVDHNSRCQHWRGETDVIALKQPCCHQWFSCYECHDALAGHSRRVWKKCERDAVAILCGRCGHGLTISAYLASGYSCPGCGGAFNPGCRHHADQYFDM